MERYRCSGRREPGTCVRKAQRLLWWTRTGSTPEIRHYKASEVCRLGSSNSTSHEAGRQIHTNLWSWTNTIFLNQKIFLLHANACWSILIEACSSKKNYPMECPQSQRVMEEIFQVWLCTRMTISSQDQQMNSTYKYWRKFCGGCGGWKNLACIWRERSIFLAPSMHFPSSTSCLFGLLHWCTRTTAIGRKVKAIRDPSIPTKVTKLKS